MTTPAIDMFVANLVFDDAGLIPAIAQQWDTGNVLMLAWMNREAVEQTLMTQRATYWSRSRRELWRKGDTSGHTQMVKSVARDCDSDALLLKVDQNGVACHTGIPSCFDTDVIVLPVHPDESVVGGKQ